MSMNLNNNKVRIEIINDHAKTILNTLKGIACKDVDCDECPCKSKSSMGFCMKSDWIMEIESLIEDTE